jgi:hypothetical protein
MVAGFPVEAIGYTEPNAAQSSDSA